MVSLRNLQWLVVLLWVTVSGTVQAQAGGGGANPVQDTDVEARGVGIAGGIMVGAELVLAVESVLRVKPVWPWLVFPAVGAAGGGVGGYFLEKKSPGGAVALLVVGMVGVIPTAIGVAAARRYNPEMEGMRPGDRMDPEKTYSFEKEPTGVIRQEEAVTEVEGPPMPQAPPAEAEESVLPVDAGGEPEAIRRHETEKRIAHLSSGSLFHFNANLGFGVGIPAVDVVPAVMPAGRYADASGIEVRVPLLSIDLP